MWEREEGPGDLFDPVLVDLPTACDAGSSGLHQTSRSRVRVTTVQR